MIRQKPLTPDLEALVEELASGIQSYPETDRETIMQIARELNDKAVYGQKQKLKDALIELLGYDTRGCQVTGSVQTIPENIIYLINLGVEDIRKVVTRRPEVLSLNIENTLMPRVEYLKSIGVKEEDIGKVVVRHPSVLVYSIENMEAKVEYLKSIGVKEQDIGKLVTRFPGVLVYSLGKIDTKVEYLKSIGVKDIGKVVVRFPSVLGLNVEKMDTRVEYLRSIGVKEQDIGKVVTRFPGVLVYSIENMKLKVKYLRSIGVKKEDIGKVVTGLPSVLELGIERNLKPTYEFLQQKFGVNAEYIVRIPHVLSYSLEKRIKPRCEFLKSKGLENRHKASTVIIPSDKRFALKVAKCPLGEYLAFKEDYIERNKNET